MPTQQENLEMWNKPWATNGDEFHQFATEKNQDYQSWKASLVETFISPNLRRDWNVLEIGCGHGRWSEFFVGKVRSLILSDISQTCIDACKSQFGEKAATYILSGGDLSPVDSGSMDFVWSFDVFVHVDASDIQTYLHELKRIMKPGAQAILHHSDDPNFGGWRASDNSAVIMRRMVEAAGLRTVCQVDSWGPNYQYSVKLHQDVLSIVTAPSF